MRPKPRHIGLRANQHFTEKFSWSVGISNSRTDFSWKAMGLLGYDLSKPCSLWAGYRALAYDKWQRQKPITVLTTLLAGTCARR